MQHILSKMGSMDMKSQLIGFPVVGASAGLALGAANDYYNTSIYGSSMNDPYLGSNWDFVLTGAGLGGSVALVSAGIKYQAQQIKNQKVSSFQEQGLSKESARLLAMIGSS